MSENKIELPKTKFHMIINKHVLDALKTLPDESIDIIITSPPYYGLRRYPNADIVWGGDSKCKHEFVSYNKIQHSSHGDSQKSDKYSKQGNISDEVPTQSFCKKCGAWYGQLGQEPTYQMYLDHLLQVTAELKRVLKSSGTMFWVMGDSYGGTMGKNSGWDDEENINNYDKTRLPIMKRDGKQKSLILLPERLAIRMEDEQGWYIRNMVIWNKPNHLPSSVSDRFSNAYEFVIFATKSKKYYFNLDAIRIKPKNELKPLKSIDPANNNTNNLNNENDGKNSKDFIGNWLSEKYLKGSGHSNRQGLNRPLNIVTIKAYQEYQRPIALYLKSKIRPEHKVILDQTFGRYKWRHWIRTDLSGAALPNVNDWYKLKEILNLDDTFDDKIYESQKLNIPIFQSGANPGDVLKITTKPFSGAHFAVFPPDLVETFLLTAPKEVCTVCGSPKKLKTERYAMEINDIPKSWGVDKNGNYKGTAQKNYEFAGAQDPSETKRRIINSYLNPTNKVLWAGCEHNIYKPAIVLDPFAGSGTTSLVGLKNGMSTIAIEISPEYCDMIKQRMNWGNKLEDAEWIFINNQKTTEQK
ncbi:MAG: DNA methyltransferase [Candidatus Aenigmatarchaeota archaeon]